MAVQEREERLRDTAESNNFRTLFFTLCKIELCVAVFGYTQVQHPPLPPPPATLHNVTVQSGCYRVKEAPDVMPPCCHHATRLPL